MLEERHEDQGQEERKSMLDDLKAGKSYHAMKGKAEDRSLTRVQSMKLDPPKIMKIITLTFIWRDTDEKMIALWLAAVMVSRP